ncbi:hypothetical protein [Mucilaginibacter sp.]|uniref:hypothetical protein n=1 Tax=Mucilaginibacter sp. TaxID=1882438 RepID=UPI0035BC708C
MKITILICFVILTSLLCKAQTQNDSLPKIKSVVDISWAVTRFYTPNKDSLKNACWEGCVFIRFTLDKNRQFKDVSVTKSTPLFIATAIINAFDQINSYGMLISQMNDNLNKTYILPFIISHNEGCGFPSGWEDGNAKRDPKSEKIYQVRQSRYDQSITSLLNMMKYTDKDFKLLDCVLLAPALIGATMY